MKELGDKYMDWPVVLSLQASRFFPGVRSVEYVCADLTAEPQRRLSLVHPSTAMLRRSFMLILVACAWSAASSGALGQDTAMKKVPVQGGREAGLAAWEHVYSVLTHPRCINCHTATNYPQQGDDRHRHLFNVVRGPGGKGVPALNCATCTPSHFRRIAQVFRRQGRAQPSRCHGCVRNPYDQPRNRSGGCGGQVLDRQAGARSPCDQLGALDGISAAYRIDAEYEFPYLAHTPMEPLNTTVHFNDDHADVWAGSQFQTIDQIAIAETLGLKPEQVAFHTEMAGGGFGRRATPDSHVQREAAAIAKHCKGVPVKLIWTREDDVQGGYYRPMHAHRIAIGIGADGMPVAWRHVIVGQSIVAGTPFASMLIKNGVDETAVEGVADNPYEIPNFSVSAHHPTVNVPVLWWRSVGHTHTAFVMETLVDELASRAGTDPFAYRRMLLKPDAKKLRGVIDLVDEKSAAWRNHLTEGHAAGVAFHESFGTTVGCAVDISIENKRPKIHRVTLAVDCGTVVNPLTVESQFQGGMSFGVSQLMAKGAITFKNGYAQQNNFDGYTPPYIIDAPNAVDVHIVPSTEKPSGCGEPSVPVISPAVVNALFRLTGKRYRSLPLLSL